MPPDWTLGPLPQHQIPMGVERILIQILQIRLIVRPLENVRVFLVEAVDVAAVDWAQD